ncbi:hypothetical protein EZS27_020133 [termite gut metagenome]|uniref:Uncharacterized protein n=1 Tax=termite gut metagenome TaxID=433724 RepID=A0A5J4RAY4_9ZZZZ
MIGVYIMCGLIICISVGTFIFAHTKKGKKFFDIDDE